MNFLAKLLSKVLLLLIPALIDKVKKYFEEKAEKKRVEALDRDLTNRAINEQDQRYIEDRMGAEISGKPTGFSGTSVVDSVAGLRK